MILFFRRAKRSRSTCLLLQPPLSSTSNQKCAHVAYALHFLNIPWRYFPTSCLNGVDVHLPIFFLKIYGYKLKTPCISCILGTFGQTKSDWATCTRGVCSESGTPSRNASCRRRATWKKTAKIPRDVRRGNPRTALTSRSCRISVKTQIQMTQLTITPRFVGSTNFYPPMHELIPICKNGVAPTGNSPMLTFLHSTHSFSVY